MATILNHTKLTLWQWILIIVFGSLVILISLVLILWRCRIRRNRKEKSLPSPNLAPMRKVTVRRGRMVSTSRYLSLTGSRFGLGQFMNLEEKDQTLSEGQSRSKSPFGWWITTMKDRSQSRLSQRSNNNSEDLTSSPLSKPRPAFIRQHSHKESSSSDCTLPSIINGRELAEDARINDIQNDTTAFAPRSSRYINFSRAFSPLHYPRMGSESNPGILSQIIENSPRHSTTSKRPSTVPSEMVQHTSRTNSFLSAEPIPKQIRPSQSSPNLGRYSVSNIPIPERPLEPEDSEPSLNVSRPHTAYSLPNMGERSISVRTRPTSHADQVSRNSTFESHQLPSPLPIQDSIRKPINPSASNYRYSSQPQVPVEDSPYWQSRQDLLPVGKSGRKGNVLRKKSLKRAELVSMIST